MKTASEEVTDMIFLSKWSSQTLCAAAELGVFDCLSRDGTRTANDVAAETGLDPTLLYRLLRALAALGLLHETPGRHFNLTERLFSRPIPEGRHVNDRIAAKACDDYGPLSAPRCDVASGRQGRMLICQWSFQLYTTYSPSHPFH